MRQATTRGRQEPTKVWQCLVSKFKLSTLWRPLVTMLYHTKTSCYSNALHSTRNLCDRHFYKFQVQVAPYNSISPYNAISVLLPSGNTVLEKRDNCDHLSVYYKNKHLFYKSTDWGQNCFYGIVATKTSLKNSPSESHPPWIRSMGIESKSFRSTGKLLALSLILQTQFSFEV